MAHIEKFIFFDELTMRWGFCGPYKDLPKIIRAIKTDGKKKIRANGYYVICDADPERIRIELKFIIKKRLMSIPIYILKDFIKYAKNPKHCFSQSVRSKLPPKFFFNQDFIDKLTDELWRDLLEIIQAG